MLKPVQLLTPRLALRVVSARDADALQRSWPDADVRRVQDAPGSGLWLIALADRAQAVGCVALRPSAIAASLRGGCSKALEPWVALRPEFRGRGYAQEALTAVLWHAQSATRGRCFVAVCDVPDTARDRLLRRLGFVPGYEADGVPWRVRQYCLSDGIDRRLCADEARAAAPA